MGKTKISSGFLLLVILGFTSCITTSNIRFIQVELLQPGRITFSEEIDTIAVFRRDSYQLDTTIFKYHVASDRDPIIDTAIHYRDLSVKCTNAFASYLEQQGYFLKVSNYSDSVVKNLYSRVDNVLQYPELFDKLKVDACIFLDRFELDDCLIDQKRYFDQYSFAYEFPEFKSSTALETIGSHLLWTIAIKGDTTIYAWQYPDNVYYGNSVDPEFFGNDANHRLLLANTAEYLGKAFGTKLLPSWQAVERTYCHSYNDQMLMAEKYLLEGDYKKAAEIYNPETRNKNRNIAAKAQYNMALACEMAGEMDVAIEWLVKSYSVFNWNLDHKSNCKQYISTITGRKKEIERLKQQIANND
ncbi:MAG TPA: DUF6340 family protein [Prolixibacteraceae bacterium]|jgi:hypothetical protein